MDLERDLLLRRSLSLDRDRLLDRELPLDEELEERFLRPGFFFVSPSFLLSSRSDSLSLTFSDFSTSGLTSALGDCEAFLSSSGWAAGFGDSDPLRDPERDRDARPSF